MKDQTRIGTIAVEFRSERGLDMHWLAVGPVKTLTSSMDHDTRCALSLTLERCWDRHAVSPCPLLDGAAEQDRLRRSGVHRVSLHAVEQHEVAHNDRLRVALLLSTSSAPTRNQTQALCRETELLDIAA